MKNIEFHLACLSRLCGDKIKHCVVLGQTIQRRLLTYLALIPKFWLCYLCHHKRHLLFVLTPTTTSNVLSEGWITACMFWLKTHANFLCVAEFFYTDFRARCHFKLLVILFLAINQLCTNSFKRLGKIYRRVWHTPYASVCVCVTARFESIQNPSIKPHLSLTLLDMLWCGNQANQ